MRRLSSRDRVHLTGFCSNHAASAVWPWFDMSSLPPNAPPFDTSSTVTRSVGRSRIAQIWSRSSQTPWPPEYTCIVPFAVSGTARVDSGSRKACSMRCVWNVSVTTCALVASCASTSPREYSLRESTLLSVPHTAISGSSMAATASTIGRNGEYETLTSAAAARASRRVRATTTASTSPAYDVRPPAPIMTGQSLWMMPTLCAPGMSAAVKTASTPGAASAAEVSMSMMSART